MTPDAAAQRSRPTRLILVRHGEARAWEDQIVGGTRGCQGLTARGRMQAEALRDRWASTGEVQADVVFASVLPRAIETAEIVMPAIAANGVGIVSDCDLCELHPGECDGMPWREYEERYSFDMSAEPERPMSPGGESLAGFQRRVERTIDRIVTADAGRTVVAFVHGGVVSATTLWLLASGLQERRPYMFDLTNTGITEWIRPADQETWLFVRFNDSAHLGASRL